MILVKEGSWATLSVPDHREIAPGTLRSLIRASGLTVQEFLSLTKKQSKEQTEGVLAPWIIETLQIGRSSI